MRKSYHNESYHINNYDEKYRTREDYQNALSVGELYTILEEMLKENRLHPDEKIVVSSNGFAGFAYEFGFSNKGFPLIKEICG